MRPDKRTVTPAKVCGLSDYAPSACLCICVLFWNNLQGIWGLDLFIIRTELWNHKLLSLFSGMTELTGFWGYISLWFVVLLARGRKEEEFLFPSRCCRTKAKWAFIRQFSGFLAGEILSQKNQMHHCKCGAWVITEKFFFVPSGTESLCWGGNTTKSCWL